MDTVTINTTLYRVAKERLSITATSSVEGANVIPKLQPYPTSTGVIYNPEPATVSNILAVTSILGVVSPAAPSQSVR